MDDTDAKKVVDDTEAKKVVDDTDAKLVVDDADAKWSITVLVTYATITGNAYVIHY